MRFVLSGPQSQYRNVQSAVSGAGFALVLTDQGDPDPDHHGLAPSAETRWTGAVYTQADIDAIDTPDHGLKAGDIIQGTGQIVPMKPTVPMCFLSVDGDEARVDDAVRMIAEYGWVLRAHFDVPEAPKKEPLVNTLARLGIDPAELKSLIGA